MSIWDAFTGGLSRAVTMSGGNAASDAATQQAGMLGGQQTQTDSAITNGAQNITDAFSQFTPSYYSGVANAYDAAYNPQLTQQFGIAQDQLTAQLAGNGMGGSSVGAYDNGQLQQNYNTNQVAIANAGQDAANSMKTTVNNDENNLFALNASGNSPGTTATQAQATAGAIVPQSSYPTLGNVFGAVLSPIASAQKAASSSLAGSQPFFNGPQASAPTGSGSSVN